MTENKDDHPSPKQINVRPNGPYKVSGNVPLVQKTQVVSEYGEPLTWKKDCAYETHEPYFLCRCGHSTNKPFCSSAHKPIDFDGTENVDPRLTVERQVKFKSSPHIRIKIDPYLCMDSGFCGTRNEGMGQLARRTEDSEVRSLVIAMIERCPAGALTYSFGEDEPDVEPDLPIQIATTVEITSDGPIQGPLWVTGGIPVVQSNGQTLEQRSRVTLCNCGQSEHKPLCDGTHRRHPTYVEDKSKNTNAA